MVPSQPKEDNEECMLLKTDGTEHFFHPIVLSTESEHALENNRCRNVNLANEYRQAALMHSLG